MMCITPHSSGNQPSQVFTVTSPSSAKSPPAISTHWENRGRYMLFFFCCIVNHPTLLRQGLGCKIKTWDLQLVTAAWVKTSALLTAICWAFAVRRRVRRSLPSSLTCFFLPPPDWKSSKHTRTRAYTRPCGTSPCHFIYLLPLRRLFPPHPCSLVSFICSQTGCPQ